MNEFARITQMDDYKSSALRHFESAEILQSQNQYDTAAHLLGIAAECAIKSKCGITRQDLTSTHGHLPDLLRIAKSKIQKREDVSLYNLLAGDSFKEWSINDRYSQNGKITQAMLEKWFIEAKNIFRHTGMKKRK